MPHPGRRVLRSDRGHGRDQPLHPPHIRVAVVTGGSSGIGLALARRLTDDGWRCVLVARDRDRLEAAARELGAEAESCDVGDRAQVEELARRIGERHQAISLLVNGAGMPAGGGFLAVAPERIEQVVQVNYLGGVWCLRAFLPLLRRGVPADVVNVVSVAGTIVGPSFGPYAASKHAQLAFSRAIGAELAGSGIRVHAIKPGPVPTPGFPQRQALAGRLSRHFVVEPEVVVDAILRTLARDRAETFVPRPFAIAAAAQAVAPGLLARLARRARWGR